MSPSRITASAAAPGAAREKWFAVKALAEGAELRLRGYIGEESTARDYWTGQTYTTGGMGTLKEFEDALAALGDVALITVYLTSEGGDFPTALAISSILARQKARIVCVIDGYAYSAAPVIACAADEIRAAKNALIMIHDAEYWCSGCDVASLEQAIATLKACNDAMSAAFVGKAGGTSEEWMARMTATTWMTGEQAAELKLVDVLLDEVSLSAHQPLKQVTAALKPPAHITALIDIPDSPVSPTQPSTPAPAMRLNTPLLTAATETPATPAAGTPAAPAPAAAPAAAALTLDSITAAIGTAVTGAMKPLEDRLKHLEGVSAHGLGPGAPGSPTAAAPAPVTGASTSESEKPVSNLGMVSAAWGKKK